MTDNAPVPDPRHGMRIGDAERNAAADALHEHLAAGRITLDEFSKRSAAVAVARTQADLEVLFTDLPPVASAPGLGVHPHAQLEPVPDPANSRALLIGLVVGMPFIALLLFFLTRQWLFFLLIPLVAAVFGPMIGSDDDDRPRRRRR